MSMINYHGYIGWCLSYVFVCVSMSCPNTIFIFAGSKIGP